MRVASFRYSARVGHFLRAASGTSWLTYPFPPRTALLGLLGAILGMGKDQPQQHLGDAKLAVSGAAPSTHWHKAQIRQEVYSVGRTFRSTAADNAKLQNQEWLWRPDYRVFAALPDGWQQKLEQRLEDQAFHFSPCMGLSEMLASIDDVRCEEASALPRDLHRIHGVISDGPGELDVALCLDEGLALSFLHMPRDVTSTRVFTPARYMYEREGKALPVRTAHAWYIGSIDANVMFL